MENQAHDQAVQAASQALASQTSKSLEMNASSSFTDKVSNWVAANRKAVMIGAGVAVAAAGGSAYYYYSSGKNSRRLPPKSSGDDDDAADLEAGTGKVKSGKKKSKKSKRSKSSANASTKAGVTTPPSEDAATEKSADEKAALTEVDKSDPLHLSLKEIEALSTEQRHEMAQSLKTRGNKAYSSKQFSQAITLYSRAIECEPQAVFYSNRAACYTNLNQSDLVIKDCTEALKLDPAYVKALNRRAAAKEQVGGTEMLYEALEDFTAAAILDQFRTESTTKSVDRVMKVLARERAAELWKDREPRLPSATFIKAYIDAFRAKPGEFDLETTDASPQGQKTLKLGYDAIKARDYVHAFSLINEGIEQGLQSEEIEAKALNMRGTFRFILGDAKAALEDLDKSTELKREDVQTWVKKASVHMELANAEAAMNDFEVAIGIDAEDPDIYYHRGQVHFIMGKFPDAIEQYKKSTELDPDFIFSQIQHAVALYKNEEKEKAELKFKKIIRLFGHVSPEVHNYWGELQLDQQKFKEAMECFTKALELEKTKDGPMNVVPMVNKSLAIFQSTQNFAEAERLCQEALRIDPQCDVAVGALAQLLLQQNKIQQALEMFEKSGEMARTEQELENHLTYAYATKAQVQFVAKYPEQALQMGLKSA